MKIDVKTVVERIPVSPTLPVKSAIGQTGSPVDAPLLNTYAPVASS
jgi:hypothetical protein